jgi:hypothetical protein
MERELGISYPTVRSRVEALVRALGFRETDGDGADTDAEVGVDPAETLTRQEVLERLARHEIGAEDAAVMIRNLGRTNR